MAADDEVGGVDSRKFEVNTNCNEEVTCEYCQEMKDHLEVITELKSAQLIIKLVQEEIKTRHGENEVSRNHRNVASTGIKPNARLFAITTSLKS